MEITIQINGQALPVEVSIEVYTYLDQAAHKDENLAHEQRRHWDMRELDEYIIAQECSRSYILTPEQIVCRKETVRKTTMSKSGIITRHTSPLTVRTVSKMMPSVGRSHHQRTT